MVLSSYIDQPNNPNNLDWYKAYYFYNQDLLDIHTKLYTYLHPPP